MDIIQDQWSPIHNVCTLLTSIQARRAQAAVTATSPWNTARASCSDALRAEPPDRPEPGEPCQPGGCAGVHQRPPRLQPVRCHASRGAAARSSRASRCPGASDAAHRNPSSTREVRVLCKFRCTLLPKAPRLPTAYQQGLPRRAASPGTALGQPRACCVALGFGGTAARLDAPRARPREPSPVRRRRGPRGADRDAAAGGRLPLVSRQEAQMRGLSTHRSCAALVSAAKPHRTRCGACHVHVRASAGRALRWLRVVGALRGRQRVARALSVRRRLRLVVFVAWLVAHRASLTPLPPARSAVLAGE